LSSFVKKSGEFLAGEVLAKTGGAKGDPGAGNSTGPHLHFEFDNIKDSTRYGGAGDPLPYAPLIKLGNFEPPSTDATGGPSYGYPLVNTVKWPSSNGAMGGASFSPSKASGLTPNEGSITSTITKPLIAFLPIPIATPVAVPVNKIIMKKVERKPVYGINPLSGKYGEI
jgi:murein DD-endopeptidase MepM/ murein hydrolase activator NlpD